MSSKRATQLVCLLHEGQEISALVSATVTKADFGVPFSPVFDIYEDFEIDSLEIDGEDATKAYTAGVLPKALAEAVFDALQERCWVHAEPEE